MSRHFIFLFSLAVLQFGRAQDTVTTGYPGTTQLWEKIYHQETKTQETVYYQDQSTWMRADYNGDVEEWNWYYPNGNPYFSARISDDLIQGTYRIGYRNGQIAEEIVMKDNVENGPASFYYPNGQLAAKGTYQSGEMVGKWVFYNESGMPFDGAWKWAFAADSSRTRMKGPILNGKMIGRWEYRSIDRLGSDANPSFVKEYGKGESQKLSIDGRYRLDVQGIKNCTSGELEIVGEPGDFFGKISFFSSRDRVYEVGLADYENDSLRFILPGNGGFLRLKKKDSLISGRFKYFGIRAEVEGKLLGSPSKDLDLLVHLKPLGTGVISTKDEESFPSYDQENRVLYFTRDQKIYSSRFTGTTWSQPELLAFSEDYNDSAPYVFKDGSSLLFTSNRPLDNKTTFRKKNLWRVDLVNGVWGAPYPLPNPVNTDSLGDYHGAISENGTVYFVSYNRLGGFGRSDIYAASLTNKVTNMGHVINSTMSEADVFIDPSEQYLLFASTDRADGYGLDDIYISFRNGEGWSLPQNLGSSVNSFSYEYGAWVDQKNGYLYFNSYRRGTSDIYRVRLEDIELLANYSD